MKQISRLRTSIRKSYCVFYINPVTITSLLSTSLSLEPQYLAVFTDLKGHGLR